MLFHCVRIVVAAFYYMFYTAQHISLSAYCSVPLLELSSSRLIHGCDSRGYDSVTVYLWLSVVYWISAVIGGYMVISGHGYRRLLVVMYGCQWLLIVISLVINGYVTSGYRWLSLVMYSIME